MMMVTMTVVVATAAIANLKSVICHKLNYASVSFQVLTVGFLWVLMLLWYSPTQLCGDGTQKTTVCESMLAANSSV
jgi:hypothetical protein